MNGFLLLLTVSLLVVVQVRAVPRAPAATTRFQLNGLIRFGEGMQVPGGGGWGEDPAFYHRDRDRWLPTGTQGSRRVYAAEFLLLVGAFKLASERETSQGVRPMKALRRHGEEALLRRAAETVLLRGLERGLIDSPG